MTKVAIRGPVEGTGGYTLVAPQTESNIDIELPASGSHFSGADSDGMPQLFDGTPIVESGSNSDGEWTRWADGTQHSSSKVDHDLTSNAGQDFPFPISFFGSSPVGLGGAYSPFSSVLSDWTNGVIYSNSTENWTTRTDNSDGTGAESTIELQLFATGRWK